MQVRTGWSCSLKSLGEVTGEKFGLALGIRNNKWNDRVQSNIFILYKSLKHTLILSLIKRKTDSERSTVGWTMWGNPQTKLSPLCPVSGSADLGIRVCLCSDPEAKITVCVCVCVSYNTDSTKTTEFRTAAIYWIVEPNQFTQSLSA